LAWSVFYDGAQLHLRVAFIAPQALEQFDFPDQGVQLHTAAEEFFKQLLPHGF
jgi:hypothetical protein